jgi:hypothetical protein
MVNIAQVMLLAAGAMAESAGVTAESAISAVPPQPQAPAQRNEPAGAQSPPQRNESAGTQSPAQGHETAGPQSPAQRNEPAAQSPAQRNETAGAQSPGQRNEPAAQSPAQRNETAPAQAPAHRDRLCRAVIEGALLASQNLEKWARGAGPAFLPLACTALKCAESVLGQSGRFRLAPGEVLQLASVPPKLLSSG